MLALNSGALLLGELGLILMTWPSIAKEETPLCGDFSIQSKAQKLTQLPNGAGNPIGEFLTRTSRARILREKGNYIESLKCSLSNQDFLVRKVNEASRAPLQALNALQLYNIYALLGDLKSAKSSINDAVALAETMGREKFQQDTSKGDIRANIYLKAAEAYYADDEAKSLAFLEKGASFLPKISRSSPISIAQVYISFGDQFAQMGFTENAIEHYSGAGLVYQKHKLEATPDYASLLTRLANQYSIMGKYAMSELLLDGAYLILAKNNRSRDEEAQQLKLMQAVLFSIRGQDNKALMILDEIIDEGVSQKRKSPITLEAILSKAEILLYKQDYLAIDNLLLNVVPNLQPNIEAYRETSPELIARLNLLAANLLVDGGKLQEAKIIAIDSFVLSVNKLGSRNPTTTAAAICLAEIYAKEGDYAHANELYITAVKSAVEQGSKILEAKTWADLARLEFKRRNYNLALAHVEKASALFLAFTAKEISRLPKADRLELYDQYSGILDFQYSLIKYYPEALTSSFERAINSRGLLTSIEKMQSLKLARSKYNGLKAVSIQSSNSDLSTALKPANRMQDQSRSAELILYQNNYSDSRNLFTNIPLLAKALAPDQAFVQYIRFKQYAVNPFANPVEQYAAFILLPNGAIRFITLGDARHLDKVIQDSFMASSQGLADANTQIKELHKKIIAPLNSVLIDKKRLVISLDSELNRIPFAAMSVATNDSASATKSYRFNIVNSPADIVKYSINESRTSGKQTPSVVIADPMYTQKSASILRDKNTSLTRSSLRSDIQRWAPLPFTREEAKIIAPLLNASMLLGADANISNLKGLVSPKILHIAAHAYFDPVPLELLAKNKFKASGVTSARLLYEHYLGNSGLVLSGMGGSSDSWHHVSLFSAEEAALLSLGNTEMVVLSACSTGDGITTAGNGVYGLQRSFFISGAKSVMMSLWKVDDRATEELMVRFYKRLKAGEGRSDALAAVQREFREGIPGKPDNWRHPYYWAAWQLVGDWGPIKGL